MRGRTRIGAVLLLAVGLLGAGGCMPGGGEEGAMLRGDQAFARGDLNEALAEYRLALRQGSRDVPVLVRAAHAYALTGRITEARDHYREAIDLDPDVADLAASDLLRVARRATERRDGIAAASATEAAMALKPGVSVTGLALPLARHFAQNGQYGQALPFFEKAVGEAGFDPVLIFEMALALDELGDCHRALVFFEQVRGQLTTAPRAEVDWRTGNCSMELAREAIWAEDYEEALALYRTTIELGEPRGRVAEAWFETGELLALRGDCSEAISAFQWAQREDLTGGYAERARNREDQIRFSRGSVGAC